MFHLSWFCGYAVLGFWFDFLGGMMGIWGVVVKATSVEHECGEVFEYNEVDLFHCHERAI
jgi:hypothetical protein